jgi:hypothetical protein
MFVKLFTQILDSSIADDRRLRHFFTDLLLCADPKGYVMMTESAIARRIGTTLEEVEWGIAELEKPDPRSKTPDMEGRRIERLEGTGYGWRIINFEAYKFLKSADEMREKTKERVRKHRENKALQSSNADVTPCNAGNTTKRKRQTQRKKQNEEEENTPSGEEDEIFESWNVMASQTGLPKIAKSSTERRAKAKTRLRDQFFRDNWREGIEAIKERGFLRGQNDRGWEATIDWFLKPESLIRIVEGQYKDKVPTQQELAPRCFPGEMIPEKKPLPPVF